MVALSAKSTSTLCALVVFSVSALANEPVIERQTLAQGLIDAPTTLAANADVAVIAEQRDQRAARNGWRAFGALSAATLNEIEGAGDNRRYDRLQGDIGLRHPLLGSQRGEEDALLNLDRLRLRTKAQADTRLVLLTTEFNRLYADYWLADQLMGLSDRWLKAVKPDFEQLIPQSGITLLESELTAIETAIQQGELDRREAATNRQAIRRELEALLGQSITAFKPVWPGDHGVCQQEANLRTALWRQDPAIQAGRDELALLIERGHYGVSDEIDSSVAVTHSQILEEWDDRGHETSIGLTAEMPLAVARAHERRAAWRNAQILQLQRQLEVQKQRVSAEIARALGQIESAKAGQAITERQLREARDRWVQTQQRIGIAGGTNALQALQQSIRWYQVARERLQQEADWLRARAPIETIRVPNCAGDVASAPKSEAFMPLAGSHSSEEKGR